MSMVLIDEQTMTTIANKIRNKTGSTAKMKASVMVLRMSGLHGYRTEAHALSIEPAQTEESVYTPAHSYAGLSAQVTSFNSAELTSSVDIADFTFTAQAATT